jgi:hypothetical protein
VKVSEPGGQAKEDTWAERCRRGWLVAARRPGDRGGRWPGRWIVKRG